MPMISPYLAEVAAALNAQNATAPPPPPAPVDVGDVESVYGPYDPNPNSPTYQPNPGMAGRPIVAAPHPARAIVGNTPPIPKEEQSAFGRAFSGGAPLFQNPLAGTPAALAPAAKVNAVPSANPNLSGPTDPATVPTAGAEAGATSVVGDSAPIDGPIGPPPPPEADPNAFPLLTVPGGGTIPAHEVETRGPSLTNAQHQRNQTYANAIDDMRARGELAVQDEYDLALEQERSARLREIAYQHSVAEQEDELAARQADFDSTTRQLSRMGQLDHGRFWASRSTPQKIAGAIEIMLAGFRGAPSMIMKRIDDDVRAQEFAYGAARDAANARQTAFAAAMQKYQSLGAARAMAKAASIDVLQAQFAQVAAKNKGNEVGDRAELARANLENERMLQIQQGIRYVLAQSRGPMYLDPETGLVYDLAGAHKLAEKWRENRHADRAQVAGIGGQILVKQTEGAVDADKNARAETVTLPGYIDNRDGTHHPGVTIRAPSAQEATTLRGLASSVYTAQKLVDRAKEIRKDPRWVADLEKRQELQQLQAELTLAFKDRGQLGALSGPDMDLARSATGDLTSVKPGVSKALDNFAATTSRALDSRVKTIAGVPAEAYRDGKLSPEEQERLTSTTSVEFHGSKPRKK